MDSVTEDRGTSRGWSRLAALVRYPQYKLLALALAVVAWTYVQGDEIHETRTKVPVEWAFPPDLISPEQLPAAVNLTLRGTRSATRRARDAHVILPVDLSDIGVGEHTLAFDDFQPKGLPPGVEVVATSPAQVRFALDEVADRKVSILPSLVGEPESGVQVDQVVIEPQVIEVIGPRSVVEELREVETAPIDLSGIRGNTELPVELTLPRSVWVAEGSERPRALVTVKARPAQRQLTVPVVVRDQGEWTVQPPQVTVSLDGPAERLRDLASEEVIAVVHLPDGGDALRYEVRYGAGEGPRLRVIHSGGERVRVQAVEPQQVEVRKR